MVRSRDEIVKELNKIAGTEYELLSPYTGRHSKILCRHVTCGYTWYVEAGAFMGNAHKAGSRCPNCYGNFKKTTKQFADEVNRMSNGSFVLVGAYKNAHTKVRIKHVVCGTTRLVMPNSFLSNSGCNSCPYCNGGTSLKKEWVAKRITELSNGAYKLIGSYAGCNNPIKVVHLACGTIAETTLAIIDSHKSIPTCTKCYPKSKGEGLIEQILEQELISFITQKHFPDLKHKGKSQLSYDFFIPKEKVLIEYQGIQHYKPREFFGGEQQYLTQKENDYAKKEYADTKGYTLLCVPYTLSTLQDIKKFLLSKLPM